MQLIGTALTNCAGNGMKCESVCHSSFGLMPLSLACSTASSTHAVRNAFTTSKMHRAVNSNVGSAASTQRQLMNESPTTLQGLRSVEPRVLTSKGVLRSEV